MTTTTDLAAALLRDVRRHYDANAERVMLEAEVLAALTAALDGVDERVRVHLLHLRDDLGPWSKQSADLITALLAQNAALRLAREVRCGNCGAWIDPENPLPECCERSDWREGRDAQQLARAIAALPARGVGDAYEAGLRTALGLIGSIGYGKNEDVDRGHEEAFRAVAKHLQDLRDAKSAALAPTDAAQARKAARHIENAKRLRRYDWQEWTAQDIEDAEGIICAYLALLSEART